MRQLDDHQRVETIAGNRLVDIDLRYINAQQCGEFCLQPPFRRLGYKVPLRTRRNCWGVNLCNRRPCRLTPLKFNFQLAGHKRFPTGISLDLPAGGLSDRALPDQRDCKDLHLVLLGHSLPDRVDDLFIRPCAIALDLLHDDQTLLAFNLQRERCATSGPQRPMALFDGLLDVLRVMIEAANDDQVFETAGDVEFAVVHETKIAGAQKSFLVIACKRSVKRLRSRLGLIPVPAGHAWARNPNLTDLAYRTRE